MALYRCEEWTNGIMWYCEHSGSHNWDTQLWVVPARILNMTPAEFLLLVGHGNLKQK